MGLYCTLQYRGNHSFSVYEDILTFSRAVALAVMLFLSCLFASAGDLGQRGEKGSQGRTEMGDPGPPGPQGIKESSCSACMCVMAVFKVLSVQHKGPLPSNTLYMFYDIHGPNQSEQLSKLNFMSPTTIDSGQEPCPIQPWRNLNPESISKNCLNSTFN